MGRDKDETAAAMAVRRKRRRNALPVRPPVWKGTAAFARMPVQEPTVPVAEWAKAKDKVRVGGTDCATGQVRAAQMEHVRSSPRCRRKNRRDSPWRIRVVTFRPDSHPNQAPQRRPSSVTTKHVQPTRLSLSDSSPPWARIISLARLKPRPIPSTWDSRVRPAR